MPSGRSSYSGGSRLRLPIAARRSGSLCPCRAVGPSPAAVVRLVGLAAEQPRACPGVPPPPCCLHCTEALGSACTHRLTALAQADTECWLLFEESPPRPHLIGSAAIVKLTANLVRALGTRAPHEHALLSLLDEAVRGERQVWAPRAHIITRFFQTSGIPAPRLVTAAARCLASRCSSVWPLSLPRRAVFSLRGAPRPPRRPWWNCTTRWTSSCPCTRTSCGPCSHAPRSPCGRWADALCGARKPA